MNIDIDILIFDCVNLNLSWNCILLRNICTHAYVHMCSDESLQDWTNPQVMAASDCKTGTGGIFEHMFESQGTASNENSNGFSKGGPIFCPRFR